MYLKVVKLNSLDLQAFIPLTFLHSIKIVWVCYRGGGLIIKNNNMIVSRPRLYAYVGNSETIVSHRKLDLLNQIAVIV